MFPTARNIKVELTYSLVVAVDTTLLITVRSSSYNGTVGFSLVAIRAESEKVSSVSVGEKRRQRECFVADRLKI